MGEPTGVYSCDILNGDAGIGWLGGGGAPAARWWPISGGLEQFEDVTPPPLLKPLEAAAVAAEIRGWGWDRWANCVKLWWSRSLSSPSNTTWKKSARKLRRLYIDKREIQCKFAIDMFQVRNGRTFSTVPRDFYQADRSVHGVCSLYNLISRWNLIIRLRKCVVRTYVQKQLTYPI